jgi:hypothetical protein
VYAQGDESARIFGSPDGVKFEELLQLPRKDPSGYGRADVQWQLPDGDAIVQLENVTGYGVDGTGFLLAHPVRQ